MRASWLIWQLLCSSAAAVATPPAVFHTRSYESPVLGGPDDLLFIGGSGFAESDRVVYEAARDGEQPTGHPDSVPQRSTRLLGTASIVELGDPPYSLTIRLPEEVSADSVYRLWIVNAASEWSQPVTINDVRPLWSSPAFVYATADLASLGRRIRVIGRNLGNRSAAEAPKIRLIGPKTYTLRGIASRAPALASYIAEAALPQHLAVGFYTVSVSTHASMWVDVPEQKLAVLADPVTSLRFDISDRRFGACRPDDTLDDSECLSKAIDAARRSGGGTVDIPAGTWDLYPRTPQQAVEGEFIVGNNVHLQGTGAGETTIRRHDSGQTRLNDALLVLEGDNWINGIRFEEAERVEALEQSRPVIQLGSGAGGPDVRNPQSPKVVRNVVISGNTFRHVGRAIAELGLPIERLFITHNDFGAYSGAIDLPGTRFSAGNPFRIDDAVIRWNRFVPGSYTDLTARQGAIASGLGASRRVDVSSNEVDGESTEGLQSAEDPPGFRAAFFWNMSNNHEYLLVADNHISCPGDKVGDGEAIAFDSNGNTDAYRDVRLVSAASAESVDVRGALVHRQSGQEIDEGSYYIGHWIQLIDGPGMGQTRRIQGYDVNRATSTVHFRVAPRWDIIPIAGQSRLLVARQYWQAYVVANDITQAAPRCHRSNLSGPHGGKIVMAGPSIDSVVAHNRQYDTDGIEVAQGYSVRTPSCASCADAATFQTALEVRDNLIDGEYDWSSDCSDSGLRATFGASPTPESPPPPMSLGVQFTHNVISHADGLRGGAIDIVKTWYAGPEPQHWRLIRNLLVAHNLIRDVDGSAPSASCAIGQRERIGIRIEPGGNVHGTVLYRNTCESVDVPMEDSGAETVRICGRAADNSCECRSATRRIGRDGLSGASDSGTFGVR